jgi:hypothetical protein
MKNHILTFLLLSLSTYTFSQTDAIGIEVAIGTNFNSISSSEELPSDYGIDKGIGINLSAIFIRKYDKMSLRNKLGLQVNQFQYQPGLIFTDENGNNIGEHEKKIRNIHFFISSTLTYDFNSGFYAGTGLNFGYLLSSRLQTPGITVQGRQTEVEWIENNQYDSFTFHLPLVAGYEWNKHALFVNFLIGLLNRNSGDVSISERENLLNIGYRIRLSK